MPSIANNLAEPQGKSVATFSVGSKQTQASQLLSRLRSKIVTGQLAPGERLVVSSLADTIGAGQTPVREALMRLASEGFVTLEDQRGFTVAPVSRKELEDLTQSRLMVDCQVFQLAIDHGDDAWEGEIVSSYHRLQKQNRFTDDGTAIHPEWEQRHTAFHRALMAGCPNGVLLQVHAMLHERADRYRHLAVRYLNVPRNDMAEHEAIMNAALKRDGVKAQELLRQHISRTSSIVLEKLSLEP